VASPFERSEVVFSTVRFFLMQSLAEELLLANERFYEAFAALDFKKMQCIWHSAPYVKCLHPGWHIISGFDEVMESWQLIFRNTFSMHFELEEVEAVVLGRIGIVTLREHLLTANHPTEVPARVALAATNIFELSDDGWKMILHQAGPTDDGSHNHPDVDTEDESDLPR
jgi:ketosteroid isomerase-like protein